MTLPRPLSALLFALLLVLAFPFRAADLRFDVGAVAGWLVLVPLVWLLRDLPPRRAFGWAAGAGTLGYAGVLFSDDLEMGAISGGHGIEDAAVRAVEAGCDVLLICSDEELQQRALAGLVACARADERFEQRCRAAVQRGLAMRRRFTWQGRRS